MPDFSFENTYKGLVVGIDEVGRGSWVGPVMAAAVILNPSLLPSPLLNEINDSKALKKSKREALFKELLSFKDRGFFYGLGSATAEEIDQINIHQASLLAMERAFYLLPNTNQVVAALVDGKFAPKLPCQTQTVLKGDQKSLSIAAASIIAKVLRDQYLENLSQTLPEFGWAKNAGYGTASHRAALLKHGVTPHHRRSYAPIAALLTLKEPV